MSIQIIVLFVLTYILCMVNPSIEICKKKTGEDIRRLGSMNAGCVNSIRIMGLPTGVFVIILNILKVYLTYFIIYEFTKFLGVYISSQAFKSMFIIAVMLGHCFPAVYKFNGGKGIIEGIALMTLFNPKYVLICVILSIIIMAITRTISKGALIGCILYFIISVIMGCEYIFALCIMLIIILYKHRSNIQRILTRQEKKF